MPPWYDLREVLDMSHHPSSAELAAFRRSISAPRPWDDDVDHPWEGPTFTYERSLGIGYRTDWADGYASDTAALFYRHSIARREASALRSRAYAQLPRVLFCGACDDCDATDRHYSDCPSSAQYVVASDTWEDEPRSPLPIRYQPSFVITR